MAPQLIAGGDLAEDTDTRAWTAGRALSAARLLPARRRSDIRSVSGLRVPTAVPAEPGNDVHLT
jgi:hypothetical protein